MPRPRFFKLDADRRHHLLEAAAEEFATNSYEGASLNRLIERLELSKGQFYYYFDDKADLFRTVLDWAIQQVVPDRPLDDFSGLDADTFWSSLEELGERSREALRGKSWWIGLWRHLYHQPEDPAVRQIAAEKFELIRRIHLSLIARGQALGCIRRDLPTDLLLALMFGLKTAGDRWCIDHWEALTPDERDAVSQRLFAMFRRMVEPPDAAAAGTGAAPRSAARRRHVRPAAPIGEER